MRGMEVLDIGAPITVPVGNKTLGRLFNVLGRTIDDGPAVYADKYLPIHRKPPSFEEQSVEPAMFETGIKVIDLIAPNMKGGRSAKGAPVSARPF